VLGDKEALKAIREAEDDVKAGRVRGYNEFIDELKNLEKYKFKVTRRFVRASENSKLAQNQIRFCYKKACRGSKNGQALEGSCQANGVSESAIIESLYTKK